MVNRRSFLRASLVTATGAALLSSIKASLASRRAVLDIRSQGMSPSKMNDQELLQRFAAGELPSNSLQHREHVKLAYLCLCQYPFAEAASRMRNGLRACYAAQGISDDPASGYHETMTQGWLRLVEAAKGQGRPDANADRFYERNPQLAQTTLLRLFYSRELFTSPRAKREFVPPDLAQFPPSPSRTV